MDGGTLVLGASGVGKTTATGAAVLCDGFLRAGYGGICLCAKPGEFELVERYARRWNRLNDVVRFSPEEVERWRFNPLEFEVKRATRGAGLVTNIVTLLLQACEAGGRGKNTGGGSDTFWQDALTELLTASVDLVMRATGTVRLDDVYRVIQSAPHSRDDVHAENSTWRRESECFRMLLQAGKNATSDAARGDYDLTENYWLSTFPQISEKTRGIIVSSFTALVSGMLRSPMRELFCVDTTIDPTACERGAILVIDLPVKLFGAVGAFAQVLWKMSAQKCWEQRDVRKSPVPIFLWADECQYFVSSYDAQFLATARSSRVCTVYLTQNLPTLYDALGRDHAARDKVDSLIGNLPTKIWHANGDPVTNEHAAKTIAQTWQLRQSSNQGYSTNMSQNGGSPSDVTTTVNYSDNTGVSASEQLAYQVLPQEFTMLRTGGPRHNLLVDGIIFKPGRVWNASGTNFMRVTFKQQ
jgi:type IV secretory pathway TraG/TraD family ATPase VirD4